ncbi:MAG: type I polyketide synthase, partial [Polyangiaceae bacterium]
MDERILGLLKEARRQLELERQKRSEPIAIVGIGCRLPGDVSTPEEFWNLLQRGVDTTGGVPANRWDAEELYDADPDAPGKAYVKRGAFLDDIEGFDSEFFGISPREALGMDPQQRLLLECSWEALEDAGIPPESLRGSATGVWVGLCAEDYARRILHSDDRTAIDAYSTLGNTRSIAAGRISYVLDLRGPSVQLDTACSSSLVAIHQAVQSLRSGESNLALVGGVNVMSAPESTIALCKLRALAPDGRCKTFDASADGYGRGEGCGIVVLKRLDDARAAGDRIYAVVRGSAVNHDGRSNGLTAPNGLAQEAIVRAALASAALEPTDIDYVEAHGTGTPLGDPIEVIALSRVYGENRDPSKPLYLGAVKSNLGHLEGAAGIAGLIKVALCLSHAQIAPHLHFKEPNAKIPWHRLPVRVASEAVDWPRTARPRVAAVSSFGLSGTNAHTLLEEAPPAEEIGSTTTRAAELIVLSARTSEALAFAAQRLHDHIAQTPGQSLTALAHSLATTRSALEHRLGLAITSRDALLEALALAARGEGTGGARGVSRDQRGKLAWLFTGQGAQQVGMGRQLYDAWPVFRDALERAFRALDPHLERPLRSVMWADPGSSDATLLDQTGYTQPALFALEWALAELWSSWGVEAHVLAGHSVGEITAAAVAGVFSLEDAARLVCARGRFMQALPPGGAMVSIAAPEADVLLAIAAYEQTISIAALNAPTSTVIAGVEVDVLAVAERFAARGVQTKRLTVSHAFHSPLMDPMLEDFAHVARSINFAMPKLALVSNVSGALAGSEITTPEYWVRHVREAVRFSQGVVALHAAGARVFLELGPRATLIGLVPASLAGSEASLITSLRTGRSEPVAVLEGLAAWFSQGGSVDWAQVFPSGGGRVTLPHYPWQRQRYWTDGSVTRHLVGTATAHPLLGARIASAGADAVYESLLSIKDPRWLSDHRVGGHVVVPAAAFADLLLAAAEDQLEGSEAAVQGLLLQAPLIVPETGALRLQVLVSARGSKASVYSQPAQASPATPWTLHATAELSPSGSDDGHARVDLASLRERCTDSVDVSELYASFRTIGLDYGESFRSLRTLRRGKGEAVAELELDDAAKADGYALHPTLLDGALQAVAGLLDVSGSQPLLPFEL